MKRLRVELHREGFDIALSYRVCTAPKSLPHCQIVEGEARGLFGVLRQSHDRLVKPLTCMMIVMGLRLVNAAQELRKNAMSHCPQPGARGRMVEHADHARPTAWLHALRSVPEEPRYRAKYADPAPRSLGRCWAAGPPPLQSASP